MKKFLFVTLLLSMVCSVAAIPVQAGEDKNLSGYGFATCNNYKDENRVAMYAVDGVITADSRWESTTSVKLDPETNLYQNSRGRSAWLAVEFEIETTISSAKIYWSEERAAVGHYTIQSSSDGETWTDIADANYGIRTGTGGWKDPYLDEITFPAVTAKFFRVESYAGETEEGLGSIYEFELYGDSSQYDYLNPNKETEAPTPDQESPSQAQSKNDNVTMIVVVIVVGVLCVAGIGIFTVLQLKKPGKGGGK